MEIISQFDTLKRCVRIISENISEVTIANIEAGLGFDRLFIIEPFGLSGVLVLFSINAFQINVLFSSKKMIDVHAVIDGINVFMTFVYDDHVLERRDQVWKNFTRFSTTKSGPWFMIEDFNESLVTMRKKEEDNTLTSHFYFLSSC